MMSGMEDPKKPKPEKCRFRGEEMFLADALMELSKEELTEVEVTLEDGSVVRPFRFCEIDPQFTDDEDGELGF
jgi:hypothetical protein